MSRGLPSVRVPVLSTTSVVLFPSRSRLRRCGRARLLRAASDADHDRHRRGKPQRAGTGDDEHRHGVDDGVSELGSAQPHPEKNVSTDRRRRGRRCRRPYPPVPGSARGCAGRRPRVHDPREHRFAAHPLGFHDDTAGGVDRAAGNLGTGLFSTGIGSPVIMDSSTECPSTTSPSTGTFSPGRTRSWSPVGPYRAARPGRPRGDWRAVGGARFSNALIAPPVRCGRGVRAPARTGQHDDDGGGLEIYGGLAAVLHQAGIGRAKASPQR